MPFQNPTLTFFTAEPGCDPCVAINPTYISLSKDPEFGAFTFRKLDIRDNQEEAAMNYVEAAPTFLLTGMGSAIRLENPGADVLRTAMRNYLGGKPSNNIPSLYNTNTLISPNFGAVHKFHIIIIAIVIAIVGIFILKYVKTKNSYKAR